MAQHILIGARCVIAALSIIGFAGHATAQDLCAGLKQAMRHAPSKFAALKLSNQPKPGETNIYPARRLLPGSVECVIEGGDTYTCYMARKASRERVLEVYRRDRPLLERCLSGARMHRMPQGLVVWAVSNDDGKGVVVNLAPIHLSRERPVNSVYISVRFTKGESLEEFIQKEFGR